MKQTLFEVPKMDCPSEERLIRLTLESEPHIHKLEFDLSKRQLTVYHEGLSDSVFELLKPLNFGARVKFSNEVDENDDGFLTEKTPTSESEASVLKVLLSINATMFVVEIVAGWLFQSTGLIADSLDMLADAAVYGLSFYAVGRSIQLQKKAAKFSGILQFMMALWVLGEVLRRFIVGSEPEPLYMIGVAVVALIANVSCLVLLSKHRTGGVHMKASWIFSTNDVIANIGVILAGILVAVTSSRLPDLVIGAIIGAVVLSGATKILKISR